MTVWALLSGEEIDIVVLQFGDHQGMAFRNGRNVQKSEKAVVFGDLIARDLTLDNLSENSLFHNKLTGNV